MVQKKMTSYEEEEMALLKEKALLRARYYKIIVSVRIQGL